MKHIEINKLPNTITAEDESFLERYQDYKELLDHPSFSKYLSELEIAPVVVNGAINETNAGVNNAFKDAEITDIGEYVDAYVIYHPDSGTYCLFFSTKARFETHVTTDEYITSSLQVATLPIFSWALYECDYDSQ